MKGKTLRIGLALSSLVLLGCGPKVVAVVPIDEPVEVVDPVMSRSAEAWFLDGLAALEESPPNYESAKQRFGNATTVQPNYYDGWVNLGVIAERQGDFEGGVESFTKALAVRTDDIAARLGLARSLIGARKYPQALEALRGVLGSDVGNVDAYNLMALAYMRQGDKAQAERMAKEVLTLDFENVMALNTLGILYMDQKRDALAQFVLERARGVAPQDVQVLNNLGLIAFRAERLSVAVDLFLAAVEAKPDFLAARLNLGAIYLDFLDYGLAAEHFAVAHEVAPESTAAHLGLAASLYGVGEYERAAALYEAYAAKDPEAETPVARLSRLYERQLGDQKKACFWMKRLSTMRPADQELKVTADFVCKEAGE